MKRMNSARVLTVVCVMMMSLFYVVLQDHLYLSMCKVSNLPRPQGSMEQGGRFKQFISVDNTEVRSDDPHISETKNDLVLDSRPVASLLSGPAPQQPRKLSLFLKDIFSSTKEHNIYQILTSAPDTLLMRHYCSLESFCRQNPKSRVWFLMLEIDSIEGEALQILQNLEKNYPNLRLAKLTMDLVVQGTPLQPIASSGRLKNSSFPANHLSDVLRLAVVAKAGGLYTDFDFICLKSVWEIRNSFALELPDTVMNGFFHFEPKHPFLHLVMVDDEKDFDGKQWSWNGPLLFTRSVKNYCGQFHFQNTVKPRRDLHSVIHETLNLTKLAFSVEQNHTLKEINSTAGGGHNRATLCSSFSLLHSSVVMPLYLGGMQELFNENSERVLDLIPGDSYAVHLFNKLTLNIPVAPDGGLDQIARVFCPRSHATAAAGSTDM